MTRHRISSDNPQELIDLANRFAEAQGLLAAVELGVFTELRERPASGTELCERLGLDPRPAADFLHLLVTLGLLEARDGRFANSAAAERFLVAGKAGYLGSSFGYYSRLMYPSWSGVAASLRGGDETGGADGKPRGDGWTSGFYSSVADDEETLGDFLDGLDSYNSVPGELLAAAVDWSRHRTVLDVGGARGNHAAHIAQAAPHLTVEVFDLPQLGPFFDRLMAGAGLRERTGFHGGDFFTDPLPEADVVVFGDVLHNWSPDTRRMLIGKAARAVRPGGSVLVFDRMMDEARSDRAKLIASLSMYLATKGGGSEYLESECRGYLADAGFVGITTEPFGTAGHVLAVGHRPDGTGADG
ncbi:methyltransferase [Kitasatospora sp. NPDC127116]|uniref:methyltransferase n=1 Tax=Kitasatospora sp. NPDC127116 TaxID=3345367 RepID=UPI00337ED141